LIEAAGNLQALRRAAPRPPGHPDCRASSEEGAVDRRPCTAQEKRMLKWALIFFVISLIAGVFGFTGVAKGAAGIARVLFYIALAIFLIVLIFGVFMGVLVF
jgi:uncharacterized membrane protein YtjA (UPF0391 family)